MIDDAAIDAFPPAIRSRIREKITQLRQNGHDPRHLMLLRDGTVLLDREAIEDDAFERARGRPADDVPKPR